MPHTTRPRRTLLALALVAPVWLACADGPTMPAAADIRDQSARSREATQRAAVLWQAKTREVVTAQRIGPAPAIRTYALVSVAQYGAIVDADFGGGQAQYEARRGAIAGASAEVLAYLFPSVKPSVEQLLLEEANAGSGGVHPQFKRGVAIGRAMGKVMNAWAAADRFTAPWNGVLPPTGPGMWVPQANVAPAGFQLAAMRPYFLDAPNQFRSPPPPPFGSAAFEAALAVVRQTTAPGTRTPAQVAIANFWNQFVGTPSTAGYWLERASDLAVASGLDEREMARLFALTSTAMADAQIGCFDAKYTYLYIRPTQADPSITLPAGLPGFPYGLPNHPSYPSGHSCISGAGATVVKAWFPASAAALGAEMEEAGMSRVYGGLHYVFDVTAGQTLGRQSAEWAMAYDREKGLLSAVLGGATP